MSSPLPAVVAATTADAEFTDNVLADAIFWVAGWVFDFGFESVTVVQSWQSGTSGSGVLYLFLVEDILDTGDGRRGHGATGRRGDWAQIYNISSHGFISIRHDQLVI
jgi:hypothetical protein